MSTTELHIDQQCWAQLQLGNKDALFELYSRYYHSLLFIGLKQIPDADLVKDVIQQQFLYLWEKRATITDAKNVRSYIIISFLRRLTNDWVKSRKTINLEVAWSRKEEELIEASPEERLVTRDYNDMLYKHLTGIINSLPARQRELIIMKFYDGLQYDAIVEKTGLTHRTVYNKIHEALGKIKEAFLQSPVMTGLKLLATIVMSLFQ
jgi:RNA polymerase sigma factor (sigma-70 family)